MKNAMRGMWVAACAVLSLVATPVPANLVVNGDFSSGNSGFTSSYTYSPANCFPPAIFDINTNPNSCHSSWASFGDHTTGSGNMMVVNGSEIPNVPVWSQTVDVDENTQYYFSVWIASVYPISPAELNFSINGMALGSTFIASTTVGEWQQFFAPWFSGSSTTAALDLVNQNTAFSGNDFALDDIVLDTTRPLPEPGSLLLVGIGLSVLAMTRRRNVQPSFTGSVG
jgi:hypothetical protein